MKRSVGYFENHYVIMYTHYLSIDQNEKNKMPLVGPKNMIIMSISIQNWCFKNCAEMTISNDYILTYSISRANLFRLYVKQYK